VHPEPKGRPPEDPASPQRGPLGAEGSSGSPSARAVTDAGGAHAVGGKEAPADSDVGRRVGDGGTGGIGTGSAGERPSPNAPRDPARDAPPPRR
jgi:hypothetical protein